jgi:signal transduction histidine kinase
MMHLAPRSIRARVTAAAVLLTVVLLAAVSLLMVTTMRRQLTDNLDEGLAQRADTIAAAIGSAPGEELAGDEDLLAQVVAADGRVLTSSSNLAGRATITELRPGVRTSSDVPGRAETFRLLVRPIDVDGGEAFLVVGVNDDDVTDPLGIMVGLLAITVPAVVVLLAALTWWLTGRVLRPVDSMRAQMAEISATNLGGRVSEPSSDDEVARLACTMNETLARLEDAVRRQQRFVADASHELRSPLTRMRGELEVDLAHPDLAAPEATARSLLAETIGLQHLVDDLLHLARADAGVAPMNTTAVDLDDIVLREARAVAERGAVTVDTRQVSAAFVTGDASQLQRAVHNLLDNAERHAARVVTITLAEVNGTARLTISDDGAGIPPHERDRVFERFARLDEARSRDAGGSGLGLAITREIVERHGGVIHLTDAPTTTFVVELPVRV